MTDIRLYLGAHKTATTHLQGILLANREELLTNGVSISAPQDIRKDWLPKFFKYCRNSHETLESDFKKTLASIKPNEGRWILTEENIVGVSNELATHPGIYPAVGHRLKMLKKLFPGDELTLFFSIRSFNTSI